MKGDRGLPGLPGLEGERGIYEIIFSKQKLSYAYYFLLILCNYFIDIVCNYFIYFGCDNLITSKTILIQIF